MSECTHKKTFCQVCGYRACMEAMPTSRPLGYNDVFEAVIAASDAAKAKRAVDMPTTQDAINGLHQAYVRLEELGWRNAIYCPKDGSSFEVIEAGSTGIHRARYDGDWPKGSWWIEEAGDLWPSRPVLFRPLSSQDAPAQPPGAE